MNIISRAVYLDLAGTELYSIYLFEPRKFCSDSQDEDKQTLYVTKELSYIPALIKDIHRRNYLPYFKKENTLWRARSEDLNLKTRGCCIYFHEYCALQRMLYTFQAPIPSITPGGKRHPRVSIAVIIQGTPELPSVLQPSDATEEVPRFALRSNSTTFLFSW